MENIEGKNYPNLLLPVNDYFCHASFINEDSRVNPFVSSNVTTCLLNIKTPVFTMCMEITSHCACFNLDGLSLCIQHSTFPAKCYYLYYKMQVGNP